MAGVVGGEAGGSGCDVGYCLPENFFWDFRVEQSAVQVPPRCCTVCHMAKSDSVRTNMRLRDDARFALEELAESMGISKTAVVERLVIAAHQGSSGQQDEMPRQSVPNFQQTRVVDPATIPGVTTGGAMPIPKTVLKYTCDHCQVPQSVGRYGEICGSCRGRGHCDVRANCPECCDYGTGAL